MKVLHIISSGGMYGAEAVILNMSRTLNEGSHSSVLGVFSNTSNPNLQLHERAAAEGIESHLIPCSGQVDRAAVAGIRELATRTAADVVHAHGYKADIYVYQALRGREIPFVSTCHNWINDGFRVALYGMLDRFVLRRFWGVVAVSDEVKQRLLKAGVSEEKISLIQNGIDLRPYRGAASSLRSGLEPVDAPIVGLIGRLSQEKGVDIFLRSIPGILAQVPRARFVVVGDGPDRDKLEALVDELQIRESTSLLGRRDDMPEVYASLDVVVSASRQEGLPMAILEGMASGCALVATAVGDVPKVASDGVTAVVVPAEDEKALASAVAGLLLDPDRRKRLGGAARRLIEEEFSAERMTAEYLRVYEEVIEDRGKAR